MDKVITSATARHISDVADFLLRNPWSTRQQIEDAVGLDTRTLARILLGHMELRTKPVKPGRKRPLLYALPKAPPNPYRSKAA